MSNERPDEFLSWRGRLSRPDALPEQGLDDRELSWEKLAERLREKPRRRTGYWIAAACLLLALAPVARLFRDRPGRVYLHPSVQRQVQRPARPERVAAAPGAAPAPDKAMASRTVEASGPVMGLRARSFHRAAAAVPPPLARLDGGRLSIAGPSLTAPVIQAATDTVNRLIALRPAPRKPLRIVSINEINKEGLTPSMSTGRSGFFHIGQGILGKGVSPDPASRQDQDYLLIINLSSSSQNR